MDEYEEFQYLLVENNGLYEQIISESCDRFGFNQDFQNVKDIRK